MKRKKISDADITGQKGINLIEQRVLDMGFLWRPQGLDAGIDGTIEIRDATGEVTNCLLQVQSKATANPFDGETEAGFHYTCDPRDLDYWLRGNAPVVLVLSRPKTNEAYWISVKDYFRDLDRRATRRVTFDKAKDLFDLTAREALLRLGVPADSGLYLAPPPVVERLTSNLLPVTGLPGAYFVAETEYRTPAELGAALREMEVRARPAWILKEKKIFSLYNLRGYPWNKICDQGSVEQLDTGEWFYADDPAEQRDFVRLLNRALRDDLARLGIGFAPNEKHYYFWATDDLSDKKIRYQGDSGRVTATVFRGYHPKSEAERVSYYRHAAFRGYFVRFGNTWYLQIRPDYRFTSNGRDLYAFAADRLTGKKRLDKNPTVHNQTKMWARFLAERDLFRGNPMVELGELETFEIEGGINDAAWLKHEENVLDIIDCDEDEDEGQSELSFQ